MIGFKNESTQVIPEPDNHVMPTPKQKAAPKHQTDRNTSLPQTSEQQSTALTLLGVLILGIIGLATTNKKRKRS
ncbi:hypothetical protein BVJ53_05035 [Lacticaseibacillus chiayiensis]|uniref:Gram-positive cocci surface proteins LPxTG domain-containing protein n=2 Tax=Lacticaseibacillus chiayiensis TaxID=2100821 RepID=A0A4Q1U7Y8_9LACO|nr:LPXTG cell wall anchor domain-containing protein [Lacticaseibacillus chiayiensis]RXT27008.1 hypothetical protein BVJ53_05035 [Lacticaseibacillus chiayiensis]RXT58617.1 hypothetical protein CHT97_05140 [Lacticaseibacillus chiayiensis]